MEPTNIAEIRMLLIEAETAHGAYEVSELGGKRDEYWATWYARYLRDRGLGALLPRPTDEQSLAAALEALDDRYRREQPGEAWPDFYAARLAAAELPS